MPGPPKGTPKTPGSGRKKGTPNAKTAEIKERIQKIDPIGELEKLAKNTDDEDLAARCWLGILPYGFARLSASQIDLSIPQQPVKHTVVLRKNGKAKK